VKNKKTANASGYATVPAAKKNSLQLPHLRFAELNLAVAPENRAAKTVNGQALEKFLVVTGAVLKPAQKHAIYRSI